MRVKDGRLKLLIERRMKELEIPSMREVERRAGLTQDVIRNIMRGTTKSVRAESVEPLARVLKVSVAEIVGAQNVEAQAKMMAQSSILKVYQNAPVSEKEPPIYSMVAIEREVAGIEPDAETDYLLMVDDDAMMPTFGRGDAVLIRTGETEPRTRQVYLIAPSKKAKPILRRVNIRLSDGLFDITADNDAFPPEIGISSGKLKIIGRALMAMKRL